MKKIPSLAYRPNVAAAAESKSRENKVVPVGGPVAVSRANSLMEVGEQAMQFAAICRRLPLRKIPIGIHNCEAERLTIGWPTQPVGDVAFCHVNEYVMLAILIDHRNALVGGHQQVAIRHGNPILACNVAKATGSTSQHGDRPQRRVQLGTRKTAYDQ